MIISMMQKHADVFSNWIICYYPVACRYQSVNVLCIYTIYLCYQPEALKTFFIRNALLLLYLIRLHNSTGTLPVFQELKKITLYGFIYMWPRKRQTLRTELWPVGSMGGNGEWFGTKDIWQFCWMRCYTPLLRRWKNTTHHRKLSELVLTYI